VSNGPAKFANILVKNKINDFEVKILTEDIENSSPDVYKLFISEKQKKSKFSQFIRMYLYYRKAMFIRKEFKYDYIVFNNAIIGLISAFFFKNTIGMINDDNNACISYRSLFLGKSKFNKHYIFKIFEFIFVHISKRTIVNSNYLKNIINKEYKVSNNKLYVLYKGLEDELVVFDRNTLIKKVKQSILFVKNDYKRGGLITLIDAISLLPFSVKLTLVGPPSDLKSNILAKASNISELLIYNYLDQKAVYELMKTHEVFCVPSYLEAFGVANLEATALGCKIVSAKVGGIPEALDGLKTSWLIESHQPEELKNLLLKAFDVDIKNEIESINQFLRKYSATDLCKNFKAGIEII
jgi:glycosyltransferase involved in cell wall biosynthesis